MLSAAEQYLLELVNRARLDPLGEAERYGIDLNEDLPAGTISGDAKQVLAPNSHLSQAAHDHSVWLMNNNTFSHTGAGGSSHTQRIRDAGYDLSGGWRTGENLALVYGSGGINEVSAIDTHHRGLFLSEGHRTNLMGEGFTELGVGQHLGQYTTNGRTYNASILTEKFANAGNDVYLTGVAYDDENDNRFYTPGEGEGGVSFRVTGAGSASTYAAGGYSIELAGSSGEVEVQISKGGDQAVVRVDMAGDNAKLDFVDGERVESSADLTLVSGATEGALLGSADLALSGGRAGEVLQGNGGANVISGGQGKDTIHGGEGDDTINGEGGEDALYGDGGDDEISGGKRNDALRGGDGDDALKGDRGNDKLWGHGDEDMLRGGRGEDSLYGGNEADRLFGGGDADLLVGGQGADDLRGEKGSDELEGGNGNDTLDGGGGADTLDGGAGNDRLKGWSGADWFVFSDGFGRDTVVDFNEGDRIVMAIGIGEAESVAAWLGAARQEGSDVVYDLGNDGVNTIRLEGTSFGSLDADDFSFLF